MNVRCMSLMLAAALLASATPSYADVVIGDFEQTSPGWGLWSGGVQPFNANYAYTTNGATLHQYAMQYTNPSGSGAVQSFAYSAGVAGTVADFMAHDKFLFDITFPATSTNGFAEIREIVLNSQFAGFDARLQGAAGQVGWGAGGGGAQTLTLEYDYTSNKAAWGANTPGWIEIVIQTNSDAAHGVFQLDNVRLVSNTPVIPEPASLTLVALVSLMLTGVRRRSA